MKIIFHINYRTEFGQTLKIVGDHAKLGKNGLVKAPYMFHTGDGNWTLTIDLPKTTKPFAYRYVVIDERTGADWSELYYPDRVLTLDKNQDDMQIFDQWRMPFRGSGVAIPVFSIRTEKGLGVGEFSDIKILADWAEVCGLKLIQILPVNDTTRNFTWTDSYPYNAISVFALHPMYLNIEGMGKFTKKELSEYQDLCKKLNTLPAIDYDAVMDAKWKYIRHFFKKDAEKTFETKGYKDFFKKNADWLVPYAAFCALRDRYKTPDFPKWKEFSTYDEKAVNAHFRKHFDEVSLHYFVQYHLHVQLSEASKYALDKGIRVKGDIPIGVYRYSVDTWTEPHLYHMNCQVGAPPDAFSTTGQIWGFPAYNWDEMAKDNYAWWTRRLKKMEDYFQVFRIDHILGFFRIFQMPLNVKDGLLGVFSPALPFSVEELNHRGMWLDYDRLCKPYIDGDVNEVLFIEDTAQKDHFHPRITFHSTRSYQDLDDHSKHVLNEIYNDYFYRRHNRFWHDIGLKKLRSLKDSTTMLVCGEDLGMVPDCVPGVMSELKIPSLIIQRMPNDPKVKFADLAHTPYLSVCSPSSHDMSGIRGWWEESIDTSRDFYYNELKQHGECPMFCEPWIAQLIIEQHLNSPSLWAVFPIQDLLAMNRELRFYDPQAEQINIPANNDKHYWRYRFHHTIEDMMKFDEFNQKIAGLVKKSGRF
ncbi:MAG: 4-alpha-glucanotransferase [Bacteroidales bacterium]|nr:4-alpha-glucanotransferase [Bacteroidales bacterium]